MINSPEPYIVQVQEPDFIDFAEERLELGYDYGMVGGPEFKTEVIEVADGREQRNVLRHLPLGRWQLGQREIADSEVDKLEEVSYLLKFHEERKGAKQGFRFKDWADYRGVDQVLAVGDGLKTKFQLRKAYVAGDAVTYRPIQKPVVGTVDLLVDGVNVAVDPNHGWIVDHETGIVSNEIPLANSAVLSASFEFDVPVWFETDTFSLNLGYYNPETKRQLYELSSIFVVEGRLPLTLPWDIPPQTEITEELNLGIVYQTTEKFQYKTAKLALNSGFTRRESKREDKRILFDYGERTFDQKELDTLLGYFWNCRGKAEEFTIADKGDQYIVRFNGDSLNIKFEAASDDDALFKVSGLKLQLKEKILYRKPPFSVQFEPIVINPENPEDSIILQSNTNNYAGGTYGGINATNEIVESLTELEEFKIETFKSEITGEGGNEILAPGGSKPIAGNYVVKHTFWTDTLYLLVAHTSHPFVHYLYRLINNGYSYSFVYQESQLENYKLVRTSVANKFSRIFPSVDGIYVIAAAEIYSASDGDLLTGNANHEGVMIWHLSESGVETVDFIPNSVKPNSNLSNIGSPAFVFGNKLFLNNNQTGNQIYYLGIWNNLEVYIENLGNTLYNYPLPENHLLDGEPFKLEGRIAGIFNVSSENNFNQIIENETRELFAFYDSGVSRTPVVEFGTIGKDGSALCVFQSRFYCLTNQPNCSTEEDGNFFQIFHKPSWLAPWSLIDDQSEAVSGDATNYYQRFRLGELYQPIVDQNGNFLARRYSSIVFYRRGSGNAVFLNGLLPEVNINYYKDACPTPSYGFAMLFHQGDLFSSNANPYLVFVQ